MSQEIKAPPPGGQSAVYNALGALFSPNIPRDRTLDASLVLGISVWLILNSHLENFYPHRWMAADGMLGNTLFFWASGFGIWSSLQSKRQGAAPFLGRRMLRIYPKTVIVILVFLALSTEWRPQHGLEDLASLLIWPTPYTYIRMIVPFYAALWVVDRLGPWALAASTAAAAAVYGYVFLTHLGDGAQAHSLVLGQLPDLLWWAYFWMATALGAAMAGLPVVSRPTPWRLAGLGLLVIGYLGLKLAMVVTQGHMGWFPLLHVAVLLACIGAALTLCAPDTVRWVMRQPVIGPFLALSANLTLEIYLVHAPLAGVRGLYSLPFPLNIVLVAGLTLLGAVALNLLVETLPRLAPSGRPAQGQSRP